MQFSQNGFFRSITRHDLILTITRHRKRRLTRFWCNFKAKTLSFKIISKSQFWFWGPYSCIVLFDMTRHKLSKMLIILTSSLNSAEDDRWYFLTVVFGLKWHQNLVNRSFLCRVMVKIRSCLVRLWKKAIFTKSHLCALHCSKHTHWVQCFKLEFNMFLHVFCDGT